MLHSAVLLQFYFWKHPRKQSGGLQHRGYAKKIGSNILSQVVITVPLVPIHRKTLLAEAFSSSGWFRQPFRFERQLWGYNTGWMTTTLSLITPSSTAVQIQMCHGLLKIIKLPTKRRHFGCWLKSIYLLAIMILNQITVR